GDYAMMTAPFVFVLYRPKQPNRTSRIDVDGAHPDDFADAHTRHEQDVHDVANHWREMRLRGFHDGQGDRLNVVILSCGGSAACQALDRKQAVKDTGRNDLHSCCPFEHHFEASNKAINCPASHSDLAAFLGPFVALVIGHPAAVDQ